MRVIWLQIRRGFPSSATATAMAQQRVIRVRAHDGRSTAVTLAASATVKDLRAELRASFAPAQAFPAFHLFLKGAKLIAEAKVGNLPVGPGESISFIPVTAKSLPPHPPAGCAWKPSSSAPNPWNLFSARKRKFSWHGGAGDDIYAKIAKPSNPEPPQLSCHGTQPLDPAQMVEHLRQGLGKAGQIIHVEEIPGREATFADLPGHLSSCMRDALRSIGVTRLYAHQGQAVQAAVSGEHVVVSTATSSGKSLCYNIPVLESIPQSSTPCALYIFPTKALAQDQLKTLLEMKPAFRSDFDVSIYDADTAMKDQTRIRNNARLLITNPDMLHMSILPCHGQFKRILYNLKYIVIDEAHSYKGAFGCHAALILRRLKRICSYVYGSNPTFIFCTATLANLDRVVLVDNDTSPCGSKNFLLWNPPVVTAQDRRSKNPVLEVSFLILKSKWVGFDRILKSSNQISDSISLDHLPPYSFETQAVWVQIPQSVRTTMEQREYQLRGGVHAASHALLSIIPLHMMCSGSDLGTQCEPQENSETSDRILLYDKHPGGIGLASQAKLLFGELLVAALELVSSCSCTNSDGCPNCIQSFACSDYNKDLDKEAAILILKGVIQYEKLYFEAQDGCHQTWM